MATSIKWMNRAGMVSRGKRIILAHWNNRTLDLEARMGIECVCETWFRRNVHRYAATVMGPKVKAMDDRRMMQAFWRDVVKALEIEHGIRET